MLKRNGYGQSQMDGDYYLVTEVDALMKEKDAEWVGIVTEEMNKNGKLRQQIATLKDELAGDVILKEDYTQTSALLVAAREQITALKAELKEQFEQGISIMHDQGAENIRQAEEILAQEKELEITTGSWATAANIVEAQIKQIAALKEELVGYAISKEDYTQASALLVAARKEIAELKAALAEKDRLLEAKEAEIGAWHSVFGTSQLTHAQSRLEEAEKQTQRQAEEIAELEAEVIRMKEHTWCAYCGYEIHIDDEAATKISEHILSCKKHPINIALADNKRQAEEIARLREALQRILDYGNRTWKEEIAQAALKSEPEKGE